MRVGGQGGKGESAPFTQSLGFVAVDKMPEGIHQKMARAAGGINESHLMEILLLKAFEQGVFQDELRDEVGCLN